MTLVANYLILGGGKFGRLALERLARQDPAARFLVVDHDPAALAAMPAAGAGRTRVQQDVIAFLVDHLKAASPWDWLLPMVPVHVAYEWLRQGPLAGPPWEAAAVPERLMELAPVARRGARGELYLSWARHRCPDDCAEPAVCPVTGESREQALDAALAGTALAGYRLRVISSRQLAPGVGGYAPGRLLDLARELDDLEGQVLIATACRCHGVIQGLARRSGGRRV